MNFQIKRDTSVPLASRLRIHKDVKGYRFVHVFIQKTQCNYMSIYRQRNTVKPVYNGHSWDLQ